MVYRVIKCGTKFILQRRCKHLWIDIDSDQNNTRLLSDVSKLQSRFEEFQKIKNKYSK